MRQFHIPPRHEELLNKAFGEWHEEKRLTGFSGASVYQITYKNNPVVVKIAHPAIIQREQQNYQEFVLDNFHNHTPKLGGYYESADGQEALLRYTYAGSVARSHTLFEFLQHGGQKAVREACVKLSEMFSLEASSRPQAWWGRGTPKRIRGAEYYDRWLPVQLTLEHFAGIVEHAILLEAGKLSQQDIVDLAPGQVVQLKGFAVEKEEAGIVTLYVGRSQAPSLRVKVTGIQGQVEPDAPLYAIIKETRQMLLERYAEAAVGPFAMHFPTFTIEGYSYTNPFYHLDELLNTQYETYIATIHGDLNLRNILLEEQTPAAPHWLAKRVNRLFDRQSYDWWLIDFASTQSGPVLLDLQWLETQVINWLLVPALQRAGATPHTLAQVLEALHKRRTMPLALRTAELRAAYTLLYEIRRLATGYLAEPEHNPDRWQEYYRGLTLALISTLKQEALSNELGGQAKTFALAAAATVVRWSGVKRPPEPRSAFPQWLRYAVGGALLALMTLGAVLFWRASDRTLRAPTLPALATLPTATMGAVAPITPTLTTTATTTGALHTGSTNSRLDLVKERGYLICGINGNLPLFGWDPANPKHRSWDPATPTVVDTYENAEGFDVDFCRVIAVAIFDDYVGRVKFVSLGAKERFQAVAMGVVDVLVRNTSWTADRDSGLGVDFGAINFYSKQKLIVPKKLNYRSWQDLAGKKICVLPGTTTQTNLETLRPKLGWEALTSGPGGEFKNNREVAEALKAEYCQALTSDGDQLAAFRRQPNAGEAMIYLSPDEYVILDIDDPAIPEEPRALVVPTDDSRWRKVVNYAVWATIYAEEIGINRQNVKNYGATAELRSKEFLGLPDPRIPPAGQIGALLGLSPQFARNIIEKLGNYGELYEEHLGAYIPERGANQVWSLNPAGRLSAPPFILGQLALPTAPATATPTPAPAVPITIGIAIDLQDKESLLGDNQEKGARLAETFYQNTIPGITLQLAIENTNSDPAGAQRALDKLLAQEAVIVIGPTLSSQAKVIAPLAQAARLPLLGPSNTAIGIAQLGCYISRISPPVTQLDPLALAQIYRDHPDIQRVAVAYLQGNTFTEDEAQVFIDEVTRRGWSLAVTATYTNTESNFAPHATKLLQAQPELIIIAGLTKDGGLLAKALRSQGYQGLLIGGNGFNTTGIFNVCKGDCNGIIVAQAYDSRQERAVGTNLRFMEAYAQAYQSHPSPIAAQMFSAVQIVKEALLRVNAQKALTTFTEVAALREALNQALLAGEPFADTPLGAIALARNGEVIQDTFYVAQLVVEPDGANSRFQTLNEFSNAAVDELRAAPADCPAGYLP